MNIDIKNSRGSKPYSYRVACLAAAVCAAAAMTSFAETTLTWNGADGAAWTGENWLDGETPTNWVDGASAVFPDAATVTIDGAVTVSNLTTAGALTVTGIAASSNDNEVFLPKNNSVLVFPGLRLSEITALTAVMGGNAITGGSSIFPADGYRYTYNGTTGSVQFQILQGIIKCVNVELTEESDGIHAKSVSACYVQDGTFWKGMDVYNANVKGNNVATSRTASGYGVCNLAAYKAKLGIVGAADFGGKFTFSKMRVEVTAPIAQAWTNAVECPNGRLDVRGLSDATGQRTFGITDPNVEKAAAQWMSSTAGATVLTNLVLTRATPARAVMRGTAIGFNANPSIYHYKFDGETMSFQLQFYSGGIKGALVELKQVGANVTAQRVRGWWWPTANGGTTDMLGCDLVAKQAELGTSVIENNNGSYGVKSLTFNTVETPSLTLSVANSCQEAIVDNAQLVFTTRNAMPTFVVARNDSQINYGPQFTYADGGTSSVGAGMTQWFEFGSTLLPQQGLVTKAQAKYVLDASTFYNLRYHNTSLDGNNYINELVLTNGSRVVGNPLRCGYFNVTNETHYVSAGSAPNEIDTGIDIFRHNTTGNMTNILIITTTADLAITGRIYDSPGDANKGGRIIKRGAATLTLSGNNTFAGRFTIEAGTVELGSNSALPATAPLTLSGGTVTCGATANSTGPLTLSGNATINLGSGSLAFADSSGEAWANGKILVITGNDSIPTQSLRFGTGKNGLTRAQLRQITYNGERVALDPSGYLCRRSGFVLIIK